MELKKYGAEYHGELGEFIRYRFTPEYCKRNGSKNMIDVGMYSGKEFNDLFGSRCANDDITIEIANDVDGVFECVCENGIEVYQYDIYDNGRDG